MKGLLTAVTPMVIYNALTACKSLMTDGESMHCSQ